MEQGGKVIELGCGTGVPGMVMRQIGANVVLTEQPDLVPLLDHNLEKNFAGDKLIKAAELSWAEDKAIKLSQTDGPFDIILSADCIFPPVYGDSWIPLAHTIHALLREKPTSVALVSVQRRNGDKMEQFHELIGSKQNPNLSSSLVQKEGVIEIHEIKVG
mmetsp:Transcript_21709/g.33994  ORF Transcript_21709/g.33994 Transcript_21709/m.33994 type:complete len:160 (-) Transcript_21709:72-551(-)